MMKHLFLLLVLSKIDLLISDQLCLSVLTFCIILVIGISVKKSCWYISTLNSRHFDARHFTVMQWIALRIYFL